jgi:NAD(P)-dependent dehydrogenase (short-subunit alcohol dehydrogenase family)
MSLAPFLETTDGDWQWMFGVNFWGVVHGLRTFVPRMQQQGGPAHVVNTASLAGVVPIEGFQGIIYTATKYGVVAVSEKLRQELEGTGIDVSVVCPGGVATGIFTAERNRPQQYGGPATITPQSADLAEGLDERMAQMKSPDEVARIILDGVRANKLYIFTHANEREHIEKRFQHMLADIEGVPE